MAAVQHTSSRERRTVMSRCAARSRPRDFAPVRSPTTSSPTCDPTADRTPWILRSAGPVPPSGPSISWRQAIGDHYGGLGPLGVAPAFRGRGLGFALLALAVEHLRGLGAEDVVIDWTTLVDFYRPP